MRLVSDGEVEGVRLLKEQLALRVDSVETVQITRGWENWDGDESRTYSFLVGPEEFFFVGAELETEARWARRWTAIVSFRKIKSNSSGYPGHTRFDFWHCVHTGRISSHCGTGEPPRQ